jgi:hypothetical protein
MARKVHWPALDRTLRCRLIRTKLNDLPPHLELTTGDVAVALGQDPNTLIRWRCQGYPRLPFRRTGRRVFYRLSVVRDFKRRYLRDR